MGSKGEMNGKEKVEVKLSMIPIHIALIDFKIKIKYALQ